MVTFEHLRAILLPQSGGEEFQIRTLPRRRLILVS